MAIDFVCPGCGQTLRVPDSAAGKQAKCPHCSTVSAVSVPAPPPPEKPLRDEEIANPYAAPTIELKESWPVSEQIVNCPVGVDQVMGHAWRVWRTQLGLLVGVFVTMIAVNIAISIPFAVAKEGLARGGDRELAILVDLFGRVLDQLISLYLGIGNAQICLNLARGRPAEFSQLFGGGPRFLPVLGLSILLGIAVFVGFLACIVPGVILLLMLWPAYYAVLDGKAGVMEAFSVAKTITDNNYGTAIVLWLISIGICLLGLLALCVGVIFAVPLISMMWATAYLMMSGQLGRQPEGHLLQGPRYES